MNLLKRKHNVLAFAALLAALFSLAYYFQNLYIHINGLLLGSPVYKSNSAIPPYLAEIPSQFLPAIKMGSNILHILLNVLCGLAMLRLYTRTTPALKYYAAIILLTAVLSLLPVLFSAYLSEETTYLNIRANGVRILRSPLMILLALALTFYADYINFRRN